MILQTSYQLLMEIDDWDGYASALLWCTRKPLNIHLLFLSLLYGKLSKYFAPLFRSVPQHL